MNIFRKTFMKMALKAAGFPGMSYSASDSDLARAVSRLTGTMTYTGKSVTEDSAMQISAVWGCVRVLAETIGSLPGSIYQRDNNGNATKVPGHNLTTVLGVSPNADMTGVEFIEAMITNLALRGNCYALKTNDGAGDVTALWPVRSEDVEPKRNRVTGDIIYSVCERGQWEDYPQSEVWHVRGFGTNGLIGYSPIAYARQNLGMALAAEEFQAKFFAHGASPQWLVSIPKWLDKDQREIARENLSKLWGGLENAYKAQLLEGGMTATQATMPLEDAQFLQLRGLSIQEIARLYRMPPHMIGDLSRSTNNNIEQQSLEFVMYTLQPYLRRIEMSVAKWLMKPADRLKYFYRYNVDGLLRADAATRAELHSKYVGNAIMSRNEVRAIENLNRSDAPGMDDYTCQIALAPIDMLRPLSLRAAAPKPVAVTSQNDPAKAA